MGNSFKTIALIGLNPPADEKSKILTSPSGATGIIDSIGAACTTNFFRAIQQEIMDLHDRRDAKSYQRDCDERC